MNEKDASTIKIPTIVFLAMLGLGAGGTGIYSQFERNKPESPPIFTELQLNEKYVTKIEHAIHHNLLLNEIRGVEYEIEINKLRVQINAMKKAGIPVDDPNMIVASASLKRFSEMLAMVEVFNRP